MGLENLRNEMEMKTPERRKAKKPLIEKQRRRRINESLNELKILVLQALNKDPSLYSKMEKADILDLTVNYLKSMKCEQGFIRDSTSLAKYRAGYNDCAGEMTRFLMTDAALDYHSKAKLLSQVASCCQNANLRTTANVAGSRAAMVPHSAYMRPVINPGIATATCPVISPTIPIFPAGYTTAVDTGKCASRYPPTPVKAGGSTYCRLVMPSSDSGSTPSFRSTGASSVWRPW